MSNIIHNNQTSHNINKFLFTYSLNNLFTLEKMLRIVKNITPNRQLLNSKCFIIHVGSICIGEKTYA